MVDEHYRHVHSVVFQMEMLICAVCLHPRPEMEIDEFFAGYESARPLFEAVRQIMSGHDAVEQRISKSQIAYRRRLGFAWVWIPGRYLRGPVAPLVLSVALRRRDGSARWKEIVEPKPGRFIHHLELLSVADIDAEVMNWIHDAWASAG